MSAFTWLSLMKLLRSDAQEWGGDNRWCSYRFGLLLPVMLGNNHTHRIPKR